MVTFLFTLLNTNQQYSDLYRVHVYLCCGQYTSTSNHAFNLVDPGDLAITQQQLL